ncbi:PREDICTED: protein kintoun [Mandrillus leucophaeus]|uniref:protein kintoun n=1 Tax=Mandrillus leucophaeus TaxID=9568 RepID=UPI0005F410C7|nr:PREDICTED: protein kintoun [Mandrillus leucophaeus]
MAKAEASSSLEDLDLSGEEVQRLTSAFQDPEFRRMFSQYAEELTNPENRRRYEAEITALERERGVEVRFVHPEPGHVLRTSLDGTRRCFVNVCSNALVGAPSSRPGSDDDRGAAPGSHWSLPYSLAPGREYAGRNSSRYMVYDVVFHPDALALARRHEGFRQMLDATALEAVEKQFGVKLDRRNAKTLKAKYKGTPEAAVLRTPLPGVILARPEGEPKGPRETPGEQDLSTHAGSPPGSVEEPSPGGENSPGGGGSLCTSCRGLAWESYAGRESARGDTGVETRAESEGKRCEPSARAMGGPGTKSGEPLCPPLLCNQDKETLTLLIQVPRIQPQSLQGDLNPLWYKLRFSTQDLVYSFFLQFAPENKLSTTEPVISISSNNAVIELAKSPESHGHWREWYYGVNNDSLEERLFVNEENVNEFLEEVLSSPFKQCMSLTPPLIEVLQVTDNKIEINAKLQECGNSDQLQGKEERVNEESPLTEKEYIEHCNTSTTDSDSSIAVKALQIDSFGSVTCFQQESLDVSQMILGKSQQPESKMQSEFIKEKSATCSNEEKDNLNESIITEEKETDGDHLSSLLNKTTVHNIPGFDSIKETNMQDGSVQVIKDHVTNCAFNFQNSLLYDLD